MDRRFFNIAALKEHQKRCPDCQAELYAIQDRKYNYGAKTGKSQDPMLYFKGKVKGSMLITGNSTDNVGAKQTIQRDRLVPNKRNLSRVRFLSKHFLQAPESRTILLECPACRYYCFVYERTSSAM